jgi:phosphatidylserine/phosphatidylglycerophosphate/cardiolipin synthase-like enzyme
MVRLLVGYDAAIAELVRELDACAEGDRITIRSYLIEPGESTDRVLRALRGALERGASATVSSDGTVASWFAHFWERTVTHFPAVSALASEFSPRARASKIRFVDHSKYAIFERSSGKTAILGGMNLGDRFRSWRDFAAHVSGEPVQAMLEALGGAGPAAVSGTTFIANVPRSGRFEVRAAYERIAGDPSITWLRVAMAYIDRMGGRILETALKRGARVELLLPGRANVYQHANMRTVARLLRVGGALRVVACHAMVHAKALVAGDASGPTVALLGSANLKRNSLIRFGELDALFTDPLFVKELDAAFTALAAEGEIVQRPHYRLIAALVEERFG